MSLILFDPVGSLLRTCLLSALAERTLCSGTWSDSATPHGRSWWVLSTSALPTAGTGCSSWVTPAAKEPGLSADRIVDRNGQTPQHLNQRLYDKHTGRMVQDGFIQQVQIAANWPTPNAADSERQSETMMRGNPTLRGAALAWPTPNAMDAERGPSKGGMEKHLGWCNLREAANWPTPRAEDSAQDAKNATLPPSQIDRDSVVAQVMQWATPTAMEGGATSRGGDRKGELLLGGQARQDAPSTHGKSRGSLNARWVAQLMGFPSDWADLPTETLSELMATRSCPRSRKSSAGR